MDTFKVLALSEAAYNTIINALRFSQDGAAQAAGQLVKMGAASPDNQAWQLSCAFANVGDDLQAGKYELPEELQPPMDDYEEPVMRNTFGFSEQDVRDRLKDEFGDCHFTDAQTVRVLAWIDSFASLNDGISWDTVDEGIQAIITEDAGA